MTFRRLTVSTPALLVVLAAASVVRADWPTCTDLDKLMDTAKQRGMPICILYLKKSAAGMGWNTRASTYENFPQYQDTLAVRIYWESEDAAFWKIKGGINTNMWNGIILVDGGGRVLGVQTDDQPVDPRQMADQANNAWQVTKWEKTTDDQLKTTDAKIAHRQYAELYAMIAKIDDTDKKISAKLKDSVPWLPGRTSGRFHLVGGSSGSVGGNTSEEKQAAKQAEDEKKKQAATERNDQWFYSEQIKEARAKLQTALQAEFDAAYDLVDAGKLPEAQKALKLIAFYKVDDDLSKKIADLKTQVDKAIKTGAKIPPRAATSATSASSAAAPAAK